MASGFVSAAARLASTPASETRIDFQGLTTGTIADFDPDAASRGLSSDVIAGVLQRFAGCPPFTALFLLDPGDALLWLEGDGAAEDPLARFVEWGSLVLEGLAEELPATGALGPGLPMLEERPLMAALLAQLTAIALDSENE